MAVKDRSRIGKITPATIRARPERATLQNEGKEIKCAVIFGSATGVIIKEKDGTEFVGLVGKFEATNIETNEVFRSGICYLPGGMHEMVTSVLLNDSNAVVNFGILLCARPSGNPRGYEWVGRDVIEQEEGDPLAFLKLKILPQYKSELKKLAAIEVPTEKELNEGIDNDDVKTLNLH